MDWQFSVYGKQLAFHNVKSNWIAVNACSPYSDFNNQNKHVIQFS